MKLKHMLKGLIITICLAMMIHATPITQWQFPNDHGVHPDYDTEWWYFTGHIQDDLGVLHGIQVTFFRQRVIPVQHSNNEWNANHYYTAHFAWLDGNTGTFLSEERHGRDAFGIVKAATSNMDIQLHDWRIQLSEGRLLFSLETKIGFISLDVSPQKPLAFHGDKGISYKGPEDNQFSNYYSWTRLNGKGTWRTESQERGLDHVSLWMDREIFNHYMGQEQRGWDWFAIQLDSGIDVMLFRVRNSKNEPTYFGGTIIHADGTTQPLSAKDFSLKPVQFWTSPKTKAKYPVKWKINIPLIDQDLIITARKSHQELIVTHPVPIHYWEGQSFVTGSTKGMAYMELVGY